MVGIAGRIAEEVVVFLEVDVVGFADIVVLVVAVLVVPVAGGMQFSFQVLEHSEIQMAI